MSTEAVTERAAAVLRPVFEATDTIDSAVEALHGVLAAVLSDVAADLLAATPGEGAALSEDEVDEAWRVIGHGRASRQTVRCALEAALAARTAAADPLRAALEALCETAELVVLAVDDPGVAPVKAVAEIDIRALLAANPPSATTDTGGAS